MRVFVASRSHRSFVLASPTAHTSLFEQQSKDRSSKQDQVNPLRAPFCTNDPGVQEYPNSRESAGPYPVLGQDQIQKGGAPGKPSDTQQEMAGLWAI